MTTFRCEYRNQNRGNRAMLTNIRLWSAPVFEVQLCVYVWEMLSVRQSMNRPTCCAICRIPLFMVQIAHLRSNLRTSILSLLLGEMGTYVGQGTPCCSALQDNIISLGNNDIIKGRWSWFLYKYLDLNSRKQYSLAVLKLYLNIFTFFVYLSIQHCKVIKMLKWF